MRRVLVTGGASGLGAALVRQLVAAGNKVLVTDVGTTAEVPAGASYLKLDVRQEADWAAAVAWCGEHWDGLDLLVNNAGIATAGGIDVETLAEWDRVLDINLLGVVRGCRAFAPVFKLQRSGHIVNTASAAGLVHPPMMSSYNTVKAGVVALSETLSFELHPHGVQVSVVCPSFFRTNLSASFQGADTAMGEHGRRMIEKSPRTADEIATAVLAGIAKQRFLIIPDRPALLSWRTKRFARPLYARQMRRIAARAAARATTVASEEVPQRFTSFFGRNQGRDPMSTPDGPRAVRDEDAFDVGAMDAWLRKNGPDLPDGEPEVRQFAGGASNLTYLLIYPGRELVLRRPPAGTKARGAHDMGREHRIQSALAPVYPYVPRMVAHCDDETVIGSEFYLMDRVRGTILRKDLTLDLDPARTRRLCTSMIDRLIDLHQVDPVRAGLADLGKGAGYVDRQIDGWIARYDKARTPNVGDFSAVTGWLGANRPADAGTCVIHNDFRFDNVVLAPDDPHRVLAVLDWELATVGDPLMDLGTVLSYWVQADDDEVLQRLRFQPTNQPGMLTRAELVGYYSERTGLRADDWTFYEVYGLFRLAAIAQQIYYRFHHGQTHNPAFKDYWAMVNYLEYRCGKVIHRS